MTSLYHRKINLLFVISVFSIIVIVLVPFACSSCGIQHVVINEGIKKYNETLDPEFCESLIEQIDTFNENCNFEIEIVDCG